MRGRTLTLSAALLFCTALCFSTETAALRNNKNTAASNATAPANSATASAKSATAPANSATAPASSATAPANSATAPASSATAPANSASTQADSNSEATDDADSASSTDTAASEDALPADEDSANDTMTADAATTADAASNVDTAASEADSAIDYSDIPEEPLGTVFPEAERKPLEIEGADDPLTEKYRNHYLTTAGRQRLAKALSNSAPYRPYIRQQLIEKNLPLILQYLPIVESNYRTEAVSRAGAVGIWQFMTNSMAPYMKKNVWYDERRDPWKSTDAALIKLADNYRMFGDWAIAIAAYNCGAGAMSRVMKKHPGKDFWYLADNGFLRSQSAQYVPQLLAIADIVENAEYYGAVDIGAADKIIEDAPVDEFEYVNVAGMFSLNEIAEVTGIEKETVFLLNPALFRNCTPARMTYELRVPQGTADAAGEALKGHGVTTDAVTYTVKEGDSLWAISRKYDITVEDLCAINGIKEKSILSIGQTLIVPIFKEGK